MFSSVFFLPNFSIFHFVNFEMKDNIWRPNVKRSIKWNCSVCLLLCWRLLIVSQVSHLKKTTTTITQKSFRLADIASQICAHITNKPGKARWKINGIATRKYSWFVNMFSLCVQNGCKRLIYSNIIIISTRARLNRTNFFLSKKKKILKVACCYMSAKAISGNKIAVCPMCVCMCQQKLKRGKKK